MAAVLVGIAGVVRLRTSVSVVILTLRWKLKLKLSLRNAQVIFNLAGDDTNVIFHTKNNNSNRNKRKCWRDYGYQVVNSCNGLLCLTDRLGYDRVVVCNPISGEFIYLPKSSDDGKNSMWFRVGLGFSPKNNQYKVFRMFTRFTKDPATGGLRPGGNMAEMHTLGTGSWRSVDISALKLVFHHRPIYLCGALHWIGWDDHNGSHCIVTFNLDEKQFHLFSTPSPPGQRGNFLDFGVIGGCLCMYNPYAHDRIEVWVMKECGVRESLIKLISTSILNDEAPKHHYRPISLLNNGVLLMFHRSRSDLMYYDVKRPKIQTSRVYWY